MMSVGPARKSPLYLMTLRVYSSSDSRSLTKFVVVDGY